MIKSNLSAIGVLGVILLAGCSGGGSSVASAGPTPTPTPTPSPSAVYVPWQPANTTVTYAVDSASATVSSGTVTASRIDAAGTGSTVTIATDSSGDLSSITFNIATPGAPFTNSYNASQITKLPSLTLGQLASALEAVNSTTGLSGFIAESGGVGLSYSAYGLWASNDTGTSGRIGALGTGAQTPSASMPTTGSATYNGSTMGVGSSTSSGPFAITGTIQLTADFSTGSITTNISNLTGQSLVTNATQSFGGTVTGVGKISGNQYTSTLQGNQVAGSMNGTFYGPAAQETAGVWHVAGPGITAMGSYGAKQ